MSQRPYRGCDGFYPASNRLSSLPPRYYDVYDADGGLVASDLIYRSRAKSMARERVSRRDGWENPMYRDMIEGGRGASPGHFFPRTSTEFSREILSGSRSPSPVPETINRFNQEQTERIREHLHTRQQKALYPETYRANSSSYNPILGRYMRTADSPGFRYYRFGNDYSDYPAALRSTPTRYRSRLEEFIYVPFTTKYWPHCWPKEPDTDLTVYLNRTALTRRLRLLVQYVFPKRMYTRVIVKLVLFMIDR